MRKLLIPLLSLLFLLACSGGGDTAELRDSNLPIISKNGDSIHFTDQAGIARYETEIIQKKDISFQLTAPGKLVASVVPSEASSQQNLILFSDSELSESYMELMQIQADIYRIAQVNIKQLEVELQRTKDLHEYGGATGQDLLNAETELAIAKSELTKERAALLEHETKLNLAGFKTEMLQTAKSGEAFISCHIPENQISKIESGEIAQVVFSSYPNDTLEGKINAVSDVIDSKSRMIKISLTIDNSKRKYKAGMYANVSFGSKASNFISIPNSAMITVKGSHYVFVKTSANKFIRKKIEAGSHVGERIIIFNGLEENEEVVVEGAMQLKGLSFGY